MQSANASAIVEEILGILAAAEQREYFGESVSQLAHALQCAALAQSAGARSDLVIAALLHDLGHLLDSPDALREGAVGVINHDTVAAAYLRERGFSEDVAALVESHVNAKRYLTAVNTAYQHRLSDASRRTLELQGGPMSKAEQEAFEQHPLFRECLQLRAWDEEAKYPERRPPGLETYRDLLLQHLAPLA
jgi:phosphonate degradation associated HDIG domain protein